MLINVNGDGNCFYYAFVLAALSKAFDDKEKFDVLCQKLFKASPDEIAQIKEELPHILTEKPYSFCHDRLLKTMADTRFRRELVEFIRARPHEFIDNIDIDHFPDIKSLEAHLLIQASKNAFAEVTEIYAAAKFSGIKIFIQPNNPLIENVRTFNPDAGSEMEEMHIVLKHQMIGIVGHYLCDIAEADLVAMKLISESAAATRAKTLAAMPKKANTHKAAAVNPKLSALPSLKSSLSVDGDDSSDEETTAKISAYNSEIEWALLQKDPKYLKLKGLLSGTDAQVTAHIKKLFIASINGVLRLYRPSVNARYYAKKPSLGEFSISTETRKEDFAEWLKDAFLETVARIFYHETDFDDVPNDFKYAARPLLNGHVEDLIAPDHGETLRAFLKKNRLKGAEERLVAFLIAKKDEDKSYKKEVDTIKKAKSIIQFNTAIRDFPMECARAYSSGNYKDHAKNVNTLKRWLRGDAAETGAEQTLFFELDLFLTYFLSATRGAKRIFFERQLPDGLDKLVLGSKGGVKLYVAMRSLYRVQKRRQLELENLQALYSGIKEEISSPDEKDEGKKKPGAFSEHAMHTFDFGFGPLHNHSTVSSKSLGFNEYAVLGGAYKHLAALIEKIKVESKNLVTDADFAKWLEEACSGQLKAKDSLVTLHEKELPFLLVKALKMKELIGHLAFLLFFIEPFRNPAAFIFSEQACYLVKNAGFTWKEMLTHEKAGKLVSGGHHPMTHVKIMESSRYILDVFKAYLPYPYFYEGEVASTEVSKFVVKATFLSKWYSYVQKHTYFGQLQAKYGRLKSISLIKDEILQPVVKELAIASKLSDEQLLQLKARLEAHVVFENVVAHYGLENTLDWIAAGFLPVLLLQFESGVGEDFDLHQARNYGFSIEEILTVFDKNDTDLIALISCEDVESWLDEMEFNFNSRVIDFMYLHRDKLGVNFVEIYQRFKDYVEQYDSEEEEMSDKSYFPYNTEAANRFLEYLNDEQEESSDDETGYETDNDSDDSNKYSTTSTWRNSGSESGSEHGSEYS